MFFLYCLRSTDIFFISTANYKIYYPMVHPSFNHFFLSNTILRARSKCSAFPHLLANKEGGLRCAFHTQHHPAGDGKKRALVRKKKNLLRERGLFCRLSLPPSVFLSNVKEEQVE